MLRPLIAVGTLLVVSVGSWAQEPAPKPHEAGAKAPASPAVELDRQVIDGVTKGSHLMTNLRYLSDDIGPRLTGSSNLERANKWTAEKMKEYGLENVRLEPWEIPVAWERGPATLKVLDGGTVRPLLVASAGWSPGTNGKVVGPVVMIEAKTKADLEKYKGKLKNAVILRSPPTPIAPITDFGASSSLTFKPEGTKKEEPKKEEPKKEEAKKDVPPLQQQRPNFEEMRAFRRELGDFLKAEGAVAILVDSAKPHGLLVTTGGWREGDRGTPQEPLPSLFVAHEHYALLHRLATKVGAEPPKVELEVSNKFIPGPITVYNTVGEIRGSEKPDEFVVIGAHLDSWDLASGTTDNGTGSCIVLETARVLGDLAKKGFKPKRTIRFVLFTGEEQGLYGSKEYVKKHKDEMPKTSAALVHDTGTGKVLGFGLLGRESVKKILEPELVSLKGVDGWKGLSMDGIRGGTDHWSFDQAGIPGFACQQDMYEYRLTHHTQSDTFDKANEPNLLQGATVMAITTLRIANLPDLLPRDRPEAKKDGSRKKPD